MRLAGGRSAARGAAIAVCALALGAFAPPAATAADTTMVQVEDLDFTGNGPLTDGGQAQGFWANGFATGTVTLPEPTTHIFVRARGDQCDGAPKVEVRIDDRPVYTGSVTSTTFWEIGAPISVPAGTHDVAVGFTNDYRHPVLPDCDRNLYVDSVSIIGQPFAPTSWRNKPLAPDAQLAPNSAAVAADLHRQVTTYGTYVNTGRFSVPVYTVPPNQKPVKVIAPAHKPELQRQLNDVALPANARPADGTDRSLAVWQPSADRYWDFHVLQKNVLGEWTTEHGGHMPSASLNPGHWIDPPGTQYGGSATSIPFLAGVQRIAELQRGVIEHAISIALPELKPGHVWPAQRDDGWKADGVIQEGTRFRLPANLDPDAYTLTPYARMVFKAMQRYGAVVTDGNRAIDPKAKPAGLFYGEDPKPYGTDPYSGGIFGQSGAYELFPNFPWHLVQVVDPSVR